MIWTFRSLASRETERDMLIRGDTQAGIAEGRMDLSFILRQFAQIYKKCLIWDVFYNMKLLTELSISPLGVQIGADEKVLLLGSCFSDEVGKRMQEWGLDACRNPFGALYNPLSILNAIHLLQSDRLLDEQDCVPMGAGAGMICSWYHHTRMARRTAPEFLSEANRALLQARAFWRECGVLIITLGTAFVYRHEGKVVANCLKRPAGEFTRQMMDASEVEKALKEIIGLASSRRVIITVSPIRHLSDGAHANTLSKAVLQIGADAALKAIEERQCCYFPSYELMLDELRDYRFYDADLVHPRDIAVDHIFERFLKSCFSEEDRKTLENRHKAFLRTQHIPILG